MLIGTIVHARHGYYLRAWFICCRAFGCNAISILYRLCYNERDREKEQHEVILAESYAPVYPEQHFVFKMTKDDQEINITIRKLFYNYLMYTIKSCLFILSVLVLVLTFIC